jgi:uncharacterized membrane protein YfcA
LTILVAALAAIGMLAGAALSHNTPAERLNKGFAAFTLAVAVFLVAKNYQALIPLLMGVGSASG